MLTGDDMGLATWARRAGARIVKRASLRDAFLRTQLGYRWLLRRSGATGPRGLPEAPWANAVLSSWAAAEAAIAQVRALGLPPHSDVPKNWDSLAALDAILRHTTPQADILDAGAALYSVLLPWLFLYGYRRLRGGSLVFAEPIRRGPIAYERMDITGTRFADATFDAIASLSVVEHGVDLPAYFVEMSRILKPGGLLITSTDYFETAIDTRGQHAYGGPIHVFTADEIRDALRIAARAGLSPTGALDLRSPERAVHWRRFDLRYTFVVFTLRKGP
jgi:SAM-dependent methyltransferase